MPSSTLVGTWGDGEALASQLTQSCCEATQDGALDVRGSAPPSNTALPKYTGVAQEGLTVLRYGVDSLYLSYPGRLAAEWDETLQAQKAAAQSEDPLVRATAQVALAGHLFEVRDRGRGRFAYVLSDNHYDLAVSAASARQLPLASVQFRSQLLTALGASAAEEALWPILLALSPDVGEPKLSRADLYVDFVTTWPVEATTDEAWITSARRVDRYRVGGTVSGWTFGKGELAGRLYDKTLEIKDSGKDYLKPLWERNGWREGERVWRLEFQFRRPALKSLGLSSLHDLMDGAGVPWAYATGKWLRLVVPSDTDHNRARWEAHPLWKGLHAIDWGDHSPPSHIRVPAGRLPNDETLYLRGLAALTAHMARTGERDLEKGKAGYFAQAERYHQLVRQQSLADYVAQKVAEKGRLFNTLHNFPDEG